MRQLLLCAGALQKLTFLIVVRWCNGSTRVFGALCHGSNPCRTATFPPTRRPSRQQLLRACCYLSGDVFVALRNSTGPSMPDGSAFSCLFLRRLYRVVITLTSRTFSPCLR